MNSASSNPADFPEAQDLAKLQAQMQRPAKNANIDGGFELGWGTMVICSGLVPFINQSLPKSFWASPWLAWISWLPLACMAFAPYAVPRMIKRFITWPRTGYVANPNDVKFLQLVLLMVFGLAVGACIGLPFMLFVEISECSGHTGPHGGLRSIILHAAELVFCAILAICLGRKVITRPQPLPTAYDAGLISQTPVGKKTLRVVRFTIPVIFVGVPLLLAGLVSSLIYVSGSMVRQSGIHWPQFGGLSFMVVTNALLFLMGNGAIIRQHRWKWLVLAVLVVGPIPVAFLFPYVSARPDLAPMLELFPPPVTLFIGLVWVLSGAATLLLFIRHNPLPAEPQ